MVSPQSHLHTPHSVTAEFLRRLGQADRVAELRPLQVLPGGRAALGGAPERAVAAGAGAREEDGTVQAEA